MLNQQRKTQGIPTIMYQDAKCITLELGPKFFLMGDRHHLCFRKTRCPTSALGCEQEKGEEKA
jgi:hypothetical protein